MILAPILALQLNYAHEKKDMKIVVLGATGRTGRLVVEQALMRGDEVVAYVRNPHGIAANPGLGITVGQLDDMLALTAAIDGADAVLVCRWAGGHPARRSALRSITGCNQFRSKMADTFDMGTCNIQLRNPQCAFAANCFV